MLTERIIACLDVHGGRVVKGRAVRGPHRRGRSPPRSLRAMPAKARMK